MTKAIYFDMDGTIANLYGVENWLEKIINEDASLYIEALPLLKLNVLARLLNNLQKKGWVIGIVSWLAKNSSENYDIEVVCLGLGVNGLLLPSFFMYKRKRNFMTVIEILKIKPDILRIIVWRGLPWFFLRTCSYLCFCP